MKTMLLVITALSTAATGSLAQTNVAAAASRPSATNDVAAAPASPAGQNASASASGANATAVEKPILGIQPKVPVDGIEGRKVNLTGVAPRVAAEPAPMRILNLFNPFAPLSEAEKRARTNANAANAMNRPLPRGFQDERTIEPVGINVITVEAK
jgi:hypothetical protein